MFFYTVIENQMNNEGQFSVLCDHYDDETLAYSKLYTVLSLASVSTIPYHSCFILRSDGLVIDGKVFDRRIPEPHPEEV